jgi:hypothetical protein
MHKSPDRNKTDSRHRGKKEGYIITHHMIKKKNREKIFTWYLVVLCGGEKKTLSKLKTE